MIDADSLEELFREVIGGIAKEPEMTGSLEHMVRASAMVVQMIQNAPTVEQTEIVRCKDCVNLGNHNICPVFSPTNDFFCGHGRKCKDD